MNQNVNFHLFPNLPLIIRLIIALGLISAGIIWQLLSGMASPGWLPVLFASVLLMYKGVDKRVIKNSMFHNADWKKINKEQVQQILDTKRKLGKWDTSVFESSGCLGGGILILLVGASLFLILAGVSNLYLMCIGMDMLVLFVPQFISGMKRFDQLVKPVLYAKQMLEAAITLEMMYPQAKIGYLVLLGVKKQSNISIPKEVKFKATFENAKEEFLGLYGQISINIIGSNMYPYFYTVQVYKKGFGLKKKMEKIQMTDKNIIKEYTEEDGVEVMIIRQYTTKTSGYHTKPKNVERILHESVRAFELLN
ncbi:MAG: hypothetical protein JXR53_04355 [Bacteroidales bacterium]|nr:hypothetical protein [Bacteroidales bacterium]